MPATAPVLDSPLRELFERIAPHADLQAPDLPRIADALVALAADHDFLAPAILEMSGRSGVAALHLPERGPRLILAHRRTGQTSAVHDHGVWVALAPISGIETHRRWRPLTAADRAQLGAYETDALRPGTCVTLMPPDDIHDHGHRMGVGDAAYVLILLGDDQLRYRRSEWDHSGGRHRVLERGDPGRWVADDPGSMRRFT